MCIKIFVVFIGCGLMWFFSVLVCLVTHVKWSYIISLLTILLRSVNVFPTTAVEMRYLCSWGDNDYPRYKYFNVICLSVHCLLFSHFCLHCWTHTVVHSRRHIRGSHGRRWGGSLGVNGLWKIRLLLNFSVISWVSQSFFLSSSKKWRPWKGSKKNWH